MKSIRTKFLVIIISGLIIMATAVGAVGVQICHTILHKDADAIMTATCQKDAANINSLFTRAQNVVNIVKDYATSEENLESAEALKDEIYHEEYNQKMENLFSTVAKNAKGLQSYYIRFAPELMNSGTAGFWYGINSSTGMIEKQPPTDILAFNENETERVGWYYQPIRAQTAIWIAPYRNFNDNNSYLISYVTPFYHDNVLLGVIGIDLDYTVLLDKVSQIKAFNYGTAYLAEDHDPNEEIHGQVAVANAELLNGMHLVLNAEYKDIQKNQRSMMWNIVLISLLIAPVFIGITIYFTQKMIRPLRELSSAAEKLAEGKTYRPIHYKGNDEISTLSEAFKSTSEKLTEYVNYVNALAYRDALTGVMSRTAYNEAIVLMERKIQDENPKFAVFVADLNNLKQINDTYGHEAGDKFIIQIAKLISETFTRSPLYRVGGDEFVAILENDDYDEQAELLEIFDEKCKNSCVEVSGAQIPVSAARGIAVYHPELDKTIDDVFEHADAAMYLYKRNSKEASLRLNETASNQ